MLNEEQIKQKADKKANKFAIKYNKNSNDLTEYELAFLFTGYKKGFIDGYHEGFKDCAKARLNVTTISDCPIKDEWHYVKDGDLPKAYQKCYFIYSNTYGEDNKVIFSKSVINVLTGVYAFFLDEETGEETTDPCFYDDINNEEIGLKEVYAWKEIVLPELPKEIE